MQNNQQMIEDDENQGAPIHERGIPSVNDRSTRKRSRIIAILVITFIVFGGAGAYLKIRSQSDNEKQPPKAPTEEPRTVPQRTFDFKPEIPEVVPQTVTALEEKAVPPIKPLPLNDPVKEIQQDTNPAAATPIEIPIDPRLSSPIIHEEEQGSTTNSPPPPGMMQVAALANAANELKFDGEEDGDTGPLNEQLKPTTTLAKNATFVPNRDYLLPKGAIFPCNMDTALDTTVAGMVRCKVAKNVYSDNGRVLLIEKGSEATGEYQSNAKQGQARIYVLWNSIRTPNGVEVPLDSPSADQLGGMGMPGHVDTHFWERFGGAMLISIAGDALAILKDQGGDGSSVVYNNTSSQADEMSQEALRNTINIPPTIYSNHGERIQIYVARNVSFESVYHVQ